MTDPGGLGSWTSVVFSQPSPEGPGNIAPFINVVSQIELNPNARVSLADLVQAYDVDGSILSLAVNDYAADGAYLYFADSGNAYNGVQSGNRPEDVPDVFWVAPSVPGSHSLEVYVTDNEFASSIRETITMTVLPLDDSTGPLPPDISYRTDAYHLAAQPIALRDFFSVSDPDGVETIQSYVIGDAPHQGRGTDFGGFLYNASTC